MSAFVITVGSFLVVRIPKYKWHLGVVALFPFIERPLFILHVLTLWFIPVALVDN